MSSVERLIDMMDEACDANQSVHIGYFINDISISVKIIPDVMETDGKIFVYDKNGLCAFNISFICDQVNYDESENVFEIYSADNGTVIIEF